MYLIQWWYFVSSVLASLDWLWGVGTGWRDETCVDYLMHAER